MSRRALMRFVVILLLAGAGAAPLRAQNAPRLIADNRTAYAADIYAWNGSGWIFVSRVMPRTWQQFPNAAEGSKWRAVIGQTVRDHSVQYVWNAGYNGKQDVWLIN